MSKYKLEFTLKQHTPLIHFQHDQDGATLRATELKPKLDRFLIQKLGLTQIVQKNGKEKEVPKEEFKHWFINDGKEHLALDYKVRIEAKEKNTNVWMEPRQNRQRKWETKFPTFFANMGKESKEELVNFTYYNDIKAFITCFIPKLKTKIDNHFPEFLFKTNFGTRQSKGFGSFYLEDERSYPIQNNWYNYKTTIKAYKKDFKTLFQKIEWFWKALRSGINEKRPKKKNGKFIFDNNGIMLMDDIFYMKPLIFLYFKQKEIQWEKKTIKEKYFNNDSLRKHGRNNYYGLVTQIKKYNDDILTFTSTTKKIIKDLLGLSSEENWRSYNAIITKEETLVDKNNNPIYNNNNEPLNVRKENRTIERFKSPITFIPIENENGYDIYLIFDENIPIKNRWFNIDNIKFQGNKPFALQVANDFTLAEFFDFFTAKNFDIKHHYKVYNENKANKIAEALNEFFDNLKKSTI